MLTQDDQYMHAYAKVVFR